MNCRELITFLETEVPLETAEGWDNPGFLVGDKDKEIKKVLVVLDITNEVVDYAIDQKAGNSLHLNLHLLMQCLV